LSFFEFTAALQTLFSGHNNERIDLIRRLLKKIVSHLDKIDFGCSPEKIHQVTAAKTSYIFIVMMLEFDGNFLQRREHIKTCLLKIIPVRQEGGYLYGDKINARVQMFDNEGNYLTGWGSFGK
jgi:hypothetical protein